MADGLLSIFLIVPFLFLAGVTSRNITIENKCDYTVWPGTYSMNEPSLSTTGFVLRKGEARVINTPSSWNGRFWGRSLCSTNTTGWFSCITGDCGSGEIECSGAAATPPATLVELSLDVYNGQDFYDVSVVDGYNLPVILAPQGGQGCRSVGCAVDLNKTCPTELKVGVEQPVACMSACQAFKSPIFCCANRTEKCQSTLYSQNFKRECPLAYSYGSDDATSTFTCPNSAEYVIRFCPSTIPNMTK